MSPRVRIEDVARAAGVSTKTVSRVINGEPHVAADMRERVERAIADLDYRPNPAARSLAAARTFLIGILGMRLDGYYFSRLHRSASQACRAKGFHLVIEEVDMNERDPIAAVERNLHHMRYEGVILCPPLSDDGALLEMLEAREIACVSISPVSDHGRSNTVVADEANGMAQLARHLWDLGHRRISLTSGLAKSVSALRSDYFARAYVALGGDSRDLRFCPMEWKAGLVEISRKLAVDSLAGDGKPTAIVSFNDETAAAMITHAHECGLSVPGDLSVVGFDDADIAQLVWPQITTIHQPLDQMARAAVSLLLESGADAKPRNVCFPVSLVVRGSTGPVPPVRV